MRTCSENGVTGPTQQTGDFLRQSLSFLSAGRMPGEFHFAAINVEQPLHFAVRACRDRRAQLFANFGFGQWIVDLRIES